MTTTRRKKPPVVVRVAGAANPPPPWPHQVGTSTRVVSRRRLMLHCDMRCLSGDAIINVNRAGRGFKMRIDDLVDRELNGWSGSRGKGVETYVRGLKADGTIGRVRLVGVLSKGLTRVMELVLDNGSRITLTDGHEIVTPLGKVRVDELRVGDAVLVDEPSGRGSRRPRRKPRTYSPGRAPDGRRLDSNGYVIVGQNRNARGKCTWILEHRAVMEKKLGRKLRKDEVVHHVNEDKLDNRPENLELLSQSEHALRHSKRENLSGVFPLAARVVSAEWMPKMVHVYDLSVEDDAHTYVANGIVVGNTGKTRMSIDAIEGLGLRRVLVVGPKIVVPVWEAQFSDFARGAWTLLLLDERAGSCKRKAELVRTVAETPGGVAVVVNYESAWREPLAQALLDFDPEALVLDEPQRIAAPDGKASKWAARAGAGNRAMVVGLTGTPGEPHKLWAQYRAITPGVLPRSFREYVTRFVNVVQRDVRYIDRRSREEKKRTIDQYRGGKNLEELGALLAPHTVRVTREVLNLVPATHQAIRVELSPEGRRVYDEMQELLVAQLASGEATAQNGLVGSLRLQQITGGWLPDDDGELTRVDSAKEDALEDLLADAADDEPVVIAARFRADLETIHATARRLGRGSLELSGTRRELDAWKAGAAPILAVQISSGGIGINLTRAHWAILYSTGFSLEHFEQFLARIHGPEQEHHHVHYDYLIARETIDEPTYGALRSKKRVVESVTEEYLKAQART